MGRVAPGSRGRRYIDEPQYCVCGLQKHLTDSGTHYTDAAGNITYKAGDCPAKTYDGRALVPYA